MAHQPPACLGLLPSLEVLPLFAERQPGADLPFRLKSYTSYGEISRNLLTRKLIGGIIPWEIFIADVLALPGQRACWKIPIFLSPCPTELVLREPLFKMFYPAQGGPPTRLPSRLTVGIESQNSLTKAQSYEWLRHWKNGKSVEVAFQMLPVDMMIHALKVEALDAIIAPSPWGIHAESTGFGKRDPRFRPGKFSQRLVMVCHREFLEQHPDLAPTIARNIANARGALVDPATLRQCIQRMSLSGNSVIQQNSLERAADLHAFTSLPTDFVPDLHKLIAELMALNDFDVLPCQVAASEQTARLLLPA